MNRYESNIKKARIASQKALVALRNLNKNGKQYDFCTQGTTQEIDILISTVKQLEKVFYQQ